MNGNEEMSQLYSNDSMMLRKLLKSWNLESLMQLFKDEGITIEVLLMLKPHHIPQLLRNYQLGLQIRFEHHLEKWRRYIDKPIQIQSDGHAWCCCCNNHTKKDFIPRSMPPNVQNHATQSPFCDPFLPDTVPPCPKSLSPSSPAPSHTSFEARMPPKLTPATPAPPAPPAPPAVSALATATNLPTPTPTPSLTPSLTPIASTSMGMPTFNNDSKTASNPRSHKNPVFSGDDYRSPHVSVTLILGLSIKGQQLLDYYREHQCLTSTHRHQLINLVATYFDDNDYHLSLQTSYNMEREILKLFPNERLESFRTEKRGKIYVKFCNMKRYKAMRGKPSNSTKRRRFGSLDGNLGVASLANKDDIVNADDEDFTMGFENWDQPIPNNDVFVKTENLYEENYR